MLLRGVFAFLLSMATSTQQKQELFKAIWATAEDLRNSVDGWDFKSYVLGILFYRFISENITNYINRMQREAGDADFDYTSFSDEEAIAAKEDLVREKGFFILPSQLFCNVRKQAKNDPNLNVTLSEIFKAIEASAVGTESEDDLKGLFADIDVNSNKLGGTVEKRNEQLTKILNNIGGIDLKGDYEDNQIDLFGDAYEYLMAMYASNAGKSGGEYYTPQEVSELLARIVSHNRQWVNKVYDPACGSGSLLLKFAKILGADNVKQGFFGQELNITTYNLCRINMFLHNIKYNKFDIHNGDTLLEPYHWDDEPFDAIVSNPPYSTKWVGKDNPLLINDLRFAPAGVLAPKSKSDLAFTMHMLAWLSTEGTAAIVEFPGVLYRSGDEQKIRKYLVDNNYVDTVIQLPQNLFFGVGIATCIIVLKKSKKENKTLFIDASQLFVHEGNKNKLSPDNINAIVVEYADRKVVKHFSALVDNATIAENGYNLSVSSYVEAEDTRPQTDIKELNARIARIVEHENKLRAEIDAIIKELEAETI